MIRQAMSKTTITEIWALRYGLSLLFRGYSDRPLISEDDVRTDFDKVLFERGATPVLVERRTVTVEKFDV